MSCIIRYCLKSMLSLVGPLTGRNRLDLKQNKSETINGGLCNFMLQDIVHCTLLHVPCVSFCCFLMFRCVFGDIPIFSRSHHPFFLFCIQTFRLFVQTDLANKSIFTSMIRGKRQDLNTVQYMMMVEVLSCTCYKLK